MGIPAQALPALGSNNATEDPKIRSCLLELQQLLTQSTTGLNGDNLAVTIAQQLGIGDSGATRRGKSIIATSEARTNTAYGLLTTPDRVQSLVLPTDGLIAVAFSATWKESVFNAARAAIFINANQLKNTLANQAPNVTETSLGASSGAGFFSPLTSWSGGLSGGGNGQANSADGTPEVTTGTAVGSVVTAGGSGICYIWAAAGTYDISVQFKASSGTVTVQNRRLWVWTMGF